MLWIHNSFEDGILIENMHDIPYIQAKYLGPEITATMSRICTELRKIIPPTVPCGLQVLAAGNKEALAIAKATSLDFIRCEGFVFDHIADEGYTEANAGLILRYRKQIDADKILIFADIKKKHSSHAVTSDISLVDTAKAAEFFLADGLIITGNATGDPANANDLKLIKETSKLPVIIGSGVTIDNLSDYLVADALIIGSHFKQNGDWMNVLDGERINNFMNKILHTTVS
ncbi:uncharacterized protein F13E9.13, mitochondrial isoform X2 [Aethina tumida]|uniref:uncharacterized protein F13E9.13, mitochondrial isoform X2 n=1 Tax=Aethina tumida TaxID=116153 RepID=UPI00096B36F6|nr:uncharacterized protein F13E9.13, mitochondrial isoform X2 [Aethina tumida]